MSTFFEVLSAVWLSRSVKGAIKLFTMLEPGPDYSSQTLSHYFTILPCFPLLHHRLKQQVPQDSKQYFILCLGSICLVHWQRLFSTNLYCHRKNSFSQMQYWFSCSPKINMTSCLKQPYLPSRS